MKNVLRHLFSKVFEEPGLKKRVGDEYLEYKQRVRRWIPRITPYNPS